MGIMALQWNQMDDLFASLGMDPSAGSAWEPAPQIKDDDVESRPLKSITTTVSAMIALSPEWPLPMTTVPLFFSAAGPLGDATTKLIFNPPVGSNEVVREVASPTIESMKAQYALYGQTSAAIHPLHDTAVMVAAGVCVASIVFFSGTMLVIFKQQK